MKNAFFVCLLAISILFASLSLAYEPQRLRMGFVPGNSPHMLVRNWNFIIRHLNREINIPVEFILKENYSDVIEAVEKGELDIIEGGTYTQSQLLNKNLIIPLVGEKRHGSYTYRSAIAVRKDSPIKTIKDFQGKSFAFTDPNSTSGYILPRILFQENDIPDLNAFFSKIYMSGSQDKAIQMLVDGLVDGVAVGDLFIKSANPDIKNKIRVITYSDAIPLGCIAAHVNLSPTLQKKIQSILLKMADIVPYETLKIANIDSFTLLDENLVRKMKALPAQAAQLKPIETIPAPIRTMVVFDKHMGKYKEKALQYLVLPSIFLVFLLLILSLLQTKGSIRKYFLISISVPITVFIITLTTVEWFMLNSSLNNHLSETKQHISKLDSDLGITLSQGNLPTQSLANQFINATPIVKAIRVFRENHYILDSTHLSSGKSIVDNILSNTFSIVPAKAEKHFELIEPIWNKDRIWGHKQVLFDLKPVQETFNKIIITHISILGVVLVLGFILYFILMNTLKKPLTQIATTLHKLKQRDELIDGPLLSNESLSKAAENLTALAEDFTNISEDIVEQNTFLELKQKQLSYAHTEKDHLENILDPELEQKIKSEIVELESKHTNFHDLRQTELVGSSPEFLKTLMDAIIRAKDNDPVLIYGPTGSGKTGIAKSIHMLSIRREKLFGEFNCVEFASADPLVVLGKLFGYGKNCGIQGIPKEGQPGLLEKYDGGTLFLDEVELIPHQAQRLLLLPLEGRPYNPAAGIGDAKQVNVRFVFATNTPLKDEIKEGLMRADFYRRINARGTISIPPLKYRKKDVPDLMDHFLKQWNRANNQTLTINDATRDYLTSLNYNNFNVSELKTTLTIAADRATFSDDTEITEKHLSQAPRKRDSTKTNKLSSLFDRVEENELAALRNVGFNITLAEGELGYSSKAKTLSNHFRGICYKLLAKTLNEKQKIVISDFTQLAQKLSEDSSDSNLTQKVANKMQRFYEKTKSANTERQQKLYNNLPKKYHEYLNILINTK